jgi:hypothetical protein
MPQLRVVIASLLLLAGHAFPVAARDVFLTIGGGYDPSGNQVSIENNAIYVQGVIAETLDGDVVHETYFSDGDDADPDLQFIDEGQKQNCPKAARIMSEVFGSADAVGLCYRNHKVPNVKGSTELAALKRRFKELGRELNAGDRLFIYVTAHGGPGAGGEQSDGYDYEYDEDEEKWVATASEDSEAVEGDIEHNTSFYLWDSEAVTAKEFNRWLDRISPDVPVVLVMVQCYAGGFANAIFHRHDPELGLAPHQRCGFFAQVHERGAAGCTPEANEADYEEYSTFFWAALGGKTRLGEKIEKPDYDGDGSTSLAEAHAYAVIESNTIDIPVRTSEALLRQYSRLGREGVVEEDEEESSAGGLLSLFSAAKPATDIAGAPEPLLDTTGPLAEFLSKTRPDQHAIIEQLVKKLELAEPVTIEAIRLKLTQATSDAAALGIAYGSASETLNDCENELEKDVCAVWPELNERFPPLAAALTGMRADEFASQVEALPSYAAWQAAKQRDTELTDELLEAQHAEARVQRLLRTIENVVYAANLPRCAPAEVVERYGKLIALEEQLLEDSD